MIRAEATGSAAAASPAGGPPSDGSDEWLALTSQPLPLGAVAAWVVRPSCGAVVTFTGTTRDHAEGRAGVTRLDYEAYAEHVVPRLAAVAAEARRRWPALGRVALLHRIGPLEVTEAAVVVAVSAPHRSEAFEAARFAIDDIKATVPIWKREHWEDGVDWGRSEAADGDRRPPSAQAHRRSTTVPATVVDA